MISEIEMKNPKGILSNLNISAFHDAIIKYPDNPPFNPSNSYPEYPCKSLSEKENRVYEAVRTTLALLNLDKEKFNTSQWNPLKEIIEPSDTVVIKPNFVLSNHTNGGDLFSIITHPSVIRAVIDYVYIALAGNGKIIIADAPQMDCNFKELLEITKLENIKEFYKNELDFNIDICDLRDFWLDTRMASAANSGNRYKLPGDTLGGIRVNLGKESLFFGLNNYKKFYGADYNREETIQHHHGNVQEYLISKTILSADVVIFIPKLKVHKKTGVTLNMKGLVGTCVNKNYLVHYTLGTPLQGGDQFPDGVLSAKERTVVKMQRWAYDLLLAKGNKLCGSVYEMAVEFGKIILKPFGVKPLDRNKSILDAGNWYGNDSAWRMVIDLLRIFIYADKDGNLRDIPRRRMFSIVDGVIGGEGNGPLAPDAKNCGLIVAGFNPCAVDLVCTRLMGFDYKKIRMLDYILNFPELFKTNLSGIKIVTNKNFECLFDEDNKNKYFNFEPHPGWKGYIEIT